MKRFNITWVVLVFMAAAIPHTDYLAVSATSPAYTHYVYMLGHAGWLHYAINAWTLLAFHNLFTWYRVLAAYLCAVIISYILLPTQPMVGASVFTCFFIGFYAIYMWYKDKIATLMTVALLALTVVLPGFAGIPHVAAYITGLLFSYAERVTWRAINFLKY